MTQRRLGYYPVDLGERDPDPLALLWRHPPFLCVAHADLEGVRERLAGRERLESQ